jgi:hypothetical protein
MKTQPDLPQIHIVVRRNCSEAKAATGFKWSVTLKAPDAAGGRYLGYRGHGTIDEDMTNLKFEYGPAVLDEKRPVWTTMNPTDRPDIRKKLTSLAINGIRKLKASTEDTFEHLIP